MKRKPKGLVLIYVVVIIGLLSIYLMELMSNSRIMLRQTRRVELVAINRNLQASAGAWARHHGSDRLQQGITLHAGLLSKRQAAIRVLPDEQAVQVQTSCILATQTHKQTRKMKFLP